MGFSLPAISAVIDAAGYVHIVGRAKDLIISGGFNVYPKEIESEIDTIEGVLESAVIGLQHLDFGEAVNSGIVVASPAPRSTRPRSSRRWGAASRLLQSPQARDLRRRNSAAQRDGQGAEGGAAGDVQGHLSQPCERMPRRAVLEETVSRERTWPARRPRRCFASASPRRL